jgi:methionyl-tRNA formyltransferase
LYRILLLAQKPIGEQCFDYLLNLNSAHLDIAAVVTNTDTNNWWRSNKIYQVAHQNSIPVISNSEKNNASIIDAIKNFDINLVISVQHAWILPPEILNAVQYQALNLHLAKLPEYKGYNTYNHAILNDDTHYSVTLHWMTDEVDVGDIAFEKSFPITPTDTAKSLSTKASVEGYELFKLLIDQLDAGEPIPRKKMNGTSRFYGRKSLDAHREIEDLNNPSEIDKKSRAFYFPPYEPAYISYLDKKIFILPSDLMGEFNKQQAINLEKA